MEKIKIIWKLYNLYILLIIIIEVLIEVLKSDRKWKIRLYNNITDLNKITIKNAGFLFNF